MEKTELHQISDASTEGYGQCTYLPPTLHADDKEVKKISALSTVIKEPSYVLEVVKRLSNWFRTKRVLGRCLKIARTWRAKAMDGGTRRGVVQDFEVPATVDIMSEAERIIIKAV